MPRPPTGGLGQKIARSAFEGFSELVDVEQRDVSFAPLDRADVGSVEPRPLGEGLLGQSRTLAEPAKSLAKLSTGILHGDLGDCEDEYESTDYEYHPSGLTIAHRVPA